MVSFLLGRIDKVGKLGNAVDQKCDFLAEHPFDILDLHIVAVLNGVVQHARDHGRRVHAHVEKIGCNGQRMRDKRRIVVTPLVAVHARSKIDRLRHRMRRFFAEPFPKAFQQFFFHAHPPFFIERYHFTPNTVPDTRGLFEFVSFPARSAQKTVRFRTAKRRSHRAAAARSTRAPKGNRAERPFRAA